MTPKITVFIALYNSENYIKETIESVLNQTFNDYEILIINDGSTDNSVNIVNQFNDSRIRLLHNEINLGIIKTRKKGILESKGKYIAILDSDDVAFSNRLKLQFDFLEKNLDYMVCGSFAEIINNKSEFLNEVIKHSENFDHIEIEMLFKNQFVNSSVLIRKSVLTHVNAYSGVQIAEDYELFGQICQKFKTKNLPIILVKYRQHANGISKIQSSSIAKAELNILKFLYKNFNLDENLLKVPHSFFLEEYSELQPDEIKLFFEKIISENKLNNYYNNELFVEVIFNKWLKIVIDKKNRKITLDFINNSIFEFKKLSFKEKRKIFKILINPFK